MELKETKTRELIDLPNGEYDATWSGCTITIHTLDGDIEAITTETSIRGIVELPIEIEDGIIYSEI